ncbi:helix-turn-helix transcriptional regulator [Saccharospirillum sp. HFRX-1]|uniref:AraC family transcriptional regulator n=1 Tax=unclassified Saccharospirillum TaxID=2633430 RepID=UPI003713A1E1
MTSAARDLFTKGELCQPQDVFAPHHHRRGQLLFADNGLARVETDQGAWVMPPQCTLWIPPGVEHSVLISDRVYLINLYVEPQAAMAMPNQCEVFEATELLVSLLKESIALSAQTQWVPRDHLLHQLLLAEIQRLKVMPFSLPLPKQTQLRALCEAYTRDPKTGVRLDDWCDQAGLSRRSLTRLFRQQTGLSLIHWCARALVLRAIERLLAGARVSAVAYELGYDNPAAFSSAFRKQLGVSPSHYLRR